MQRSWLWAACAALSLAAATSVAAPKTLRAVEAAAESSTLDLVLRSDTEGRVLARLCDACELLTLTVDAETAVMSHGARSSLRVAVERRAQGATVIFDPASRVVKRILLWD